MSIITPLSLMFFCGIGAFQLLPKIPHVVWGILIGCMLIALFSLISRMSNSGIFKIHSKPAYNLDTYKRLFIALIGLLLGFLWAWVYASWILQWHLPKSLENKPLSIVGYIASIPEEHDDYVKFKFDALSIVPKQNTYLLNQSSNPQSIQSSKSKIKLQLSWYGPHPKLMAGEKWQLLVKLKRPHGMSNPGGHNFEMHLFQHGIRATGSIVGGNVAKLTNENIQLANKKYHYLLLRVREYFHVQMQQVLNKLPLGEVIITLVLGEQRGITPSQWDVLRRSGTSYLLAISGLHVGLFATVVLSGVKFLWCRSRRLPLLIPATKAAAMFGLLAGIVYSLLSGLSIPTQRALSMLTVFIVTLLAGRNIAAWNGYYLALLVVLILNPLAVLFPGFWLSFFAVAIIIYVNNSRLKLNNSYWRKYLRMQWAVTLGLAPFTLWLFQQCGISAIVANIVALPGVCLIVVPMSLFGALLLLIQGAVAGWLLMLAEKLMEICWIWLEWCAALPYSNWQQAISSPWTLLAAVGGVLIILAPRGFPGRWVGCLWLAPLLLSKPAKPEAGALWFTLLDVGQGLAAVVQTQQHTLIYDTGPKNFGKDTGETVILPFLRFQGISKVDMLVVSHGDNDHSGGANSILQSMPVAQVLTSVPERFTGFSAARCYAGKHWQWEGVEFKWLFPLQHEFLGGNNASCVLQIKMGTQSVLLTGDIEAIAEKVLVATQADHLASTVLVAPHHGSRTSSTDALVQAVAAKYVLFPIGYLNRFKFPHKSVINRYMQTQARLFDTANYGAITFKFSPTAHTLIPEFYRFTHKHYWQELP